MQASHAINRWKIQNNCYQGKYLFKNYIKGNFDLISGEISSLIISKAALYISPFLAYKSSS